tara:strand:+ start:461 stop:616 length:156 start_codon:yes stop_codon:yes gene_type:complete
MKFQYLKQLVKISLVVIPFLMMLSALTQVYGVLGLATAIGAIVIGINIKNK